MQLILTYVGEGWCMGALAGTDVADEALQFP